MALSKATVLRAYYFASFASIGVLLPFLSPWLQALGMRGMALGTIAATRPLAGIFAPVLFGWLADNLGLRGSILRFACLGALLPFAIVAAAAGLGHRFSWVELLLAVGISSFFRVPMMTIADVAALEQRKSYGALRLWGSLGFMAAALLAGRLIEPTNAFAFPAAVTVGFLFSLALSFRFPGKIAVPKKPERRDLSHLVRHPAFLQLLLATTIWSFSHVAYDLCVSLTLRDLGASAFVTSIAWNIGVVAEIFLMATFARFGKMLTFSHWLRLGLTATVLRFMGLAFATTLPQVLWLQPLHALSFALVWMAAMALVKERAPVGLLGTAQGLFSTACSIGATLGMLLFGSLFEHYNARVTFLAAALVAVIGVVVMALHETAGNTRPAETHTGAQ